jgi:hypothetical protein
MKKFIFLLVFLFPCFAGATLPYAKEPAKALSHLRVKKPLSKIAFGKEVPKTTSQKLENKASLSGGKRNGKWLCISGFIIGVLGILPWLIWFDLGLFLSFPLAILSIIGLSLSSLGLKKSRRKDGTRVMKGIAIAGIVLNGLVLAGGLIHLVVFNGR